MAKIWYKNTELIRLTKTENDEVQHGTPLIFDGVIEFDGDTNQNAINGLDIDWNSHTIENDLLCRNGQPVIIYPPGENWIANENKEDIRARFLFSQLQDKTPEEIYMMMQNRMDNWTTIAEAKEDLREWLPLMASAIAWIVMK